jgi:hypothetical protein
MMMMMIWSVMLSFVLIRNTEPHSTFRSLNSNLTSCFGYMLLELHISLCFEDQEISASWLHNMWALKRDLLPKCMSIPCSTHELHVQLTKIFWHVAALLYAAFEYIAVILSILNCENSFLLCPKVKTTKYMYTIFKFIIHSTQCVRFYVRLITIQYLRTCLTQAPGISSLWDLILWTFPSSSLCEHTICSVMFCYFC